MIELIYDYEKNRFLKKESRELVKIIRELPVPEILVLNHPRFSVKEQLAITANELSRLYGNMLYRPNAYVLGREHNITGYDRLIAVHFYLIKE